MCRQAVIRLSVERSGGENGPVAIRFVRRGDGLTYEFLNDGVAHGYPSFKRVGRALWCRRLPGFGWSVCGPAGEVFSRPFDDPGQGELPPEGAWASRKGDRSYVYDLVRADARTGANL